MSELYLIAHKVRGEAAFDVAQRTACPLCQWYENTMGDMVCGGAGEEPKYKQEDCAECDQLGYWWIIPTSGHRAYPWWNFPIDGFVLDNNESIIRDKLPTMPHNLPDHYPHGPAPKINIKALMKKSDWMPNPEAFIKRRL